MKERHAEQARTLDGPLGRLVAVDAGPQRRDLAPKEQIHDVGRRVAVRAECPFGMARRARGIEHRGFVVGREFNFGRRRARVDHAEKIFETHEAQACVGIPEVSSSSGVIAEYDNGREKVKLIEAGPYSLESFLVDEEHRGARVAESVK